MKPMRTRSLMMAAAAFVCTVGQLQAQTSVTTPPVGFNKLTLLAGNNLRVNTFVQAKAFQGAAQSVTSASNSVITVSGTLTASQFNEVNGVPGYYVEILDAGSNQGMITDVVSNTAGSITVASNLAAFSVSGTASFCVRPHTTLSTLFGSGSGLSPGTDSVKLFYPNNSNKSFLFTGSGSSWIDAGTGADAGGEVIYPGQGFIITVASPVNVIITGSVKDGPTIVPLYAGAVNVVGTINPAVGGSQTLSNFNWISTFTAGLDSVNVYNDTGALQQLGSFISTGSSLINAGTGASGDTQAVPPSNSVVVSVSQSKNWVMPSFYTPVP